MHQCGARSLRPLHRSPAAPEQAAHTRVTLHAVDEDAELCVALTVNNPPRVDGTKVPSPLSGDTAFVGDGAAVLASAATEKCDLIDRAYAAAGPRKDIIPARTCGIVTCGGLCPGLNTVVQELYRCLSTQYFVDKVWGFEGGYEGLAQGKRVDWPVYCKKRISTQKEVRHWHLETEDPAPELADAVEREALDCLFVVGGDGR